MQEIWFPRKNGLSGNDVTCELINHFIAKIWIFGDLIRDVTAIKTPPQY
jgi:hypothetical protein